MIANITRICVLLVFASAVSITEAGPPYVYVGNSGVPAYFPGVPTFPFTVANVPQVSLNSNSAPAMSDHLLVPVASQDGKTPSLAAFDKTFGTFVGWWQTIDGIVWKFVNATGAATGTTGTTGTGGAVTSAEFAQFVTQLNSKLDNIANAISGKSAGTNSQNVNANQGNTTTAQPGGPVAGTAVAPSTKPQAPQESQIDPLDKIIAALNNIKVKK